MRFLQSKFTIFKATLALLFIVLAFGFNLTAKAQTIAPALELERDIPASNLTASLMPYPNLIADRDNLIKYLNLYCAFRNNCRFRCTSSQRKRCGAKAKACKTKIGDAALRGGAYGTGMGATIGAGIGTALGGPVGGGIGGAAGSNLGKSSQRRRCRHKKTACRADYSWYSRCVSNCNAASRGNSKPQAKTGSARGIK